MSLLQRGRQAGATMVGAVSRWTTGLEFDDLLALGCDVIRETDGRASTLALTFDDGPSPHATGDVLDALDRHGARGTFFMLGGNAARYPQLVREVAARGHAIGCHGQQHLDYHWLPPWRIAEDVRRCKETLEDILGRPVDSLRAPFGHFRWDVKPIARRLGVTRLVGWSVSPAWNETSPERLGDYVAERSEAGSIVLLHDATGLDLGDTYGWNRAVVTALDPLLSTLARRGLRSAAL